MRSYDSGYAYVVNQIFYILPRLVTEYRVPQRKIFNKKGV